LTEEKEKKRLSWKDYVSIIIAMLTTTLSRALRSPTQGRVFWATQFSRWAPVPEGMQLDGIKQIRERRGLDPNPPRAEEFIERE